MLKLLRLRLWIAEGVKAFSTSYDSWWCCVGTGLENPVRYAEQIYFTSRDQIREADAAARACRKGGMRAGFTSLAGQTRVVEL